MSTTVTVSSIPIENVVQIIKIAEELAGPLLMSMIKDRVNMTEEQKAALDAHYASYSAAIEESKKSEETGRHEDAPLVDDATEGDAD